MACLKIFTNISKHTFPTDFLSKVFPVLSKCVDVPVYKCIVTVNSDCILSVSGKDEPSIVASFESIGDLGPEQNAIITKDLTDFMSKELGVDKNQIFLTFYDLEFHNVGTNGLLVSDAPLF